MKAKGAGSGTNFFGTSYIMLGSYLKGFDKYFAELGPQLSKAGLRIPFDAYVAGMVVASLIGVLGGALAGSLVALFLKSFLLLRVLLPFGFALLVGVAVFLGFYLYPQFVAGSRKRKLDSQLSYTVGHMAVLASAGMTPESMFHSLAEEES